MSLDKLDPFATRQERWLISPLTRRILAVNVLALLLLAVGFLFLGQYKTYLISSELNAMRTQANMFAVALSENATTVDMVTGQYRVSNISNQMILRLVKASGARARLFLRNGALVADSRRLTGTGGDIQVVELPPPNFAVSFLREFLDQFDEMVRWLPGQTKPPRYIESPRKSVV